MAYSIASYREIFGRLNFQKTSIKIFSKHHDSIYIASYKSYLAILKKYFHHLNFLKILKI